MVRIEKQFPVPVDSLWKAWTLPTGVSRWFGSDPGGQVVNAVIDLKVDGGFKISFLDSDNTQHTCFGKYLRIEILHRLEFTWEWLSEPGNVSNVEITFETSHHQHSHMEFKHFNLYGDSSHAYEAGWESTFVKLEKYLIETYGHEQTR